MRTRAYLYARRKWSVSVHQILEGFYDGEARGRERERVQRKPRPPSPRRSQRTSSKTTTPHKTGIGKGRVNNGPRVIKQHELASRSSELGSPPKLRLVSRGDLPDRFRERVRDRKTSYDGGRIRKAGNIKERLVAGNVVIRGAPCGTFLFVF